MKIIILPILMSSILFAKSDINITKLFNETNNTDKNKIINKNAVNHSKVIKKNNIDQNKTTKKNNSKSIKKEVSYEKLIKLLTTPEKKEEKDVIKKFIHDVSYDKSFLPLPTKSIKIGNTLLVYGDFLKKEVEDYKPKETKNQKSKKNKIDSRSQLERDINIAEGMNNNNPLYQKRKDLSSNDVFSLPKSSFSYKKREILLEIGQTFGNWEITTLTEHQVVYKNIETKQEIVKYY